MSEYTDAIAQFLQREDDFLLYTPDMAVEPPEPNAAALLHPHWRMVRSYTLVGQTPVPEPDSRRWAQWRETADCVVAKTQVSAEVEVSTVFLGLDHQWGSGPPLLFETMIFGGPHDEMQWRYTTWAEAQAGHNAAVATCRNEA